MPDLHGVLDLFGTFNGYNGADMITGGSGTITNIRPDGEAINDACSVNGSQPDSKI